MTRHKVVVAIVGISLVLMLITACATPTPSPSPTPVKDTLVVGITEIPPSLDKETLTAPMGHFFHDNLLEPLIGFARTPSTVSEGVRVLDYDNFDFRLAESFEISPDSRTITFHLRRGVKSAWGNEFTARDVYWRWERGMTIHGVSDFFAGTMGFSDLAAIKVIDDYTISFTADKPNAILAIVNAINSTSPYDSIEALKHATTDDPWASEWIGRNAPGFGPYYVTEWIAGNQAVFTANPNYYQGEPEIKKIIFKAIPESSSRVAMIQDGTLDVALELTPREINSLAEGTPGVKVIRERGLWLAHLVLNDLVVPAFGDEKVRQAVNYAIDRDKIIDMAYYGMAEPMKVVFAAQRPGALDPKEFPYDYDIEKAKQMMAESNYPDGFAVDLYYPAGLIHQETASVIIKEELAKIGIDVALRKTPSGALQTLVMAAEVPFAYWLETPYAPDPNYATALMYITGFNQGGTGYSNYTGFSDPVIDQMVMDGKPIVDPEERVRHHEELQRLILERAPVGFVVQEGYKVAIRDNIEGWNIDIGEVTKLYELSFTE